jgi:hypothetical protein
MLRPFCDRGRPQSVVGYKPGSNAEPGVVDQLHVGVCPQPAIVEDQAVLVAPESDEHLFQFG